MAEKPKLRVSYECASTGTQETTTASELSLGGMFIETTRKAPAKGAFVSMEIEAGSTKVAVDGRVLAAGPTGFSVSFIDLPNEVASALSFILATRMPRRGTQLGLGEAEEGVPKYVSERRLPVASPDPPPAAPAPAAPAPSRPTPPMAITPQAAPSVPPAPTSSAPAMVPIAHGSRPPPWSQPPQQAMPASHAPPGSAGGARVAIILAVIGIVLVAGILAVFFAMKH